MLKWGGNSAATPEGKSLSELEIPQWGENPSVRGKSLSEGKTAPVRDFWGENSDKGENDGNYSFDVIYGYKSLIEVPAHKQT